MRIGSIFFQHPIGLWGAEPYSLLAADMGPIGKGIYWDVFEEIRKGNGTDSLAHIMSMYDNVPNRRIRESYQAKLHKILSPKYNLFFVSAQEMVTIIDHTKAIREQNRRALEGPGLFDEFFEL